MDRTEKEKRIRERSDWFHSIDFGDGVVSPGVCPTDYLEKLLERFDVPARMDGLRVLDIGTYDGYFAFEFERRHAAEVVAIDVNPADCRCFDLAHRLLDSNVTYHMMGVYDLDEQKLGGKFDYVLFSGVFYHLRHIILSLDNLWSILAPGGTMIMETHVCDDHFVLGDGSVTTLAAIDPRLVDTPIFRFYRRNELNAADWSNWFGGNVAAILDCLGSAGFEAEHLASWGSRAAFRARKIDVRPREWEIGSYEGTKFTFDDDGVWTAVWHDPGKSK